MEERWAVAIFRFRHQLLFGSLLFYFGISSFPFVSFSFLFILLWHGQRFASKMKRSERERIKDERKSYPEIKWQTVNQSWLWIHRSLTPLFCGVSELSVKNPKSLLDRLSFYRITFSLGNWLLFVSFYFFWPGNKRMKRIKDAQRKGLF
jgi:hypothetical protein